ncbi:MAG: hypothetical protein JXA11_04665 [Phycisphaerae bacterium]|nr:hypothetical protein [Phycisphaerae bacterium]
MKKVIFLLLICGAILAGCSNNSGMVDDSSDRNRRLSAVYDTDERQLIDDWDEFWLFDQNLKLTEWHVFVGD